MTINIIKWGTNKKVVESTYQIPEIIVRDSRKIAVTVLVILSVEFINLLVQIIPRDDEFV